MIRPEVAEHFTEFGCAEGSEGKAGENGIECGRQQGKGAAMKRIENGGEWINAYVKDKDEKLREVAQGLRRLMKKTVAGTKETVNPWKIPTFESNGPMCLLMVGKNHVTFGFLRGTDLPDPAKLLEGTGKSLRHVKLRSTEDLRKPALKKLILAAARLNKREPMEGMKPKKRAK
jgi:hypothetical protein